MIGSGCCAEKLIALFNQRLVNRRRHQVRSIETLLEMGFSLDKIHQAMEITKYVADCFNGYYEHATSFSFFRNVFPAALDWLIQNDSSVKLLNCDTPAKTIQTTTIVAGGNEGNEASTSAGDRPPPLAEAEPDIDESANTSQAGSPSGDDASAQQHQDSDEDDVQRFRQKVDHVEVLLDVIRQYSDRDVYPTQEMVASIVEMGFNEKNVREALVATRNNQAAAVSLPLLPVFGQRSIYGTVFLRGLEI